MEKGTQSVSNFDGIFKDFVNRHETQLQSMGVPECKWKSLCRKLNDSIFDVGDFFKYAEVQQENKQKNRKRCVFNTSPMGPSDEEHIFLINHSWTYTLRNAQKTLEENSGLVERMCNIMGIAHDQRPEDERIKDIMKDMWKFNDSYTVKESSESTSFLRCWFIMDEVGSRISYSEEPNFAIAPFFYLEQNMTFSILFPISHITAETEVTRAFPRLASSMSKDMQRAIKLPWCPTDLSHLSYKQVEPDEKYFKEGRHIEILPNGMENILDLKSQQEILVYSDYPEIAVHLTDRRFKVTESKINAHILWLGQRLVDYKAQAEASSRLFYLNQFPSEQVLINKDFLSIIARRHLSSRSKDENVVTEGTTSDLLVPVTYNLDLELPQFVSYFQTREKKNLDNTWICKPFNLARGMDIFVTDNLDQIINLRSIRHMIASKYISDSVLFPKEDVGLVKMDLRFIVLLKNTKPLELFMYERFWIRFANKPFSLDNFDDYEKHFTVMNYSQFQLQQMYCDDFIRKFEDFYEGYKWSDVQEDINRKVKDIFACALKELPPRGIGNYAGSRAMYGLDVMLQWNRNMEVPTMEPLILEVNWMPDCKRACEYYPEFYNDVFSVLFLDEIERKHVVQL